MPNVVFRPRVSERVPSKTWFAELATAPGPQVIGETGDNSFDTLFGREWLLEWSVEDDTLRLYQESVTHPGEWQRVTAGLPPVFDSPLPATARRVTFCFDQSARMIVAYEDEGVIKVTRWDPGLGQYVQNVSFAGVDPAVVMDATWAYDIPNSDVLLFYLSTDRTRVMCRVQRELYADEHELWAYDEPVILDRALPVFLRYQLLVADSAGAPLEKVLLSDPYPYLARAEAAGSGLPPAAGVYTQVVMVEALPVETLTATVSGPASGAYADPLLEASVAPQELTGQGGMPDATGAYTAALITEAVNEALDGDIVPAQSGAYILAVFAETGTTQEIAGSGAGPAGGSYDTA